MSSMTTHGVCVEVEPQYLEEHSDPAAGQWVHLYHVTITNQGTQTVQLLSRHWIITNANGQQEHVRGAGVVGHQPVLRPGETFRYTSGCPMDTSMGTMHGTYQMVDESGHRFEAEIAPFALAEPYSVH